MNTNQNDLLRLPEPVFHRILRHLDLSDIKNLSLSCYGLLSTIEDIQNTVPRLHVIAISSTNQHKKAARMIPEAYPGSYIIQSDKRVDHHQPRVISLSCSPSFPPTYNEAQTANWSYAFRSRKKPLFSSLAPRVWLCPHGGCLLEEIIQLAHQQPSPLPSTHNTVPALCPFPKCALWARHALIATQTTPCTFEICSAIRIYRCRCSSYEEIQNKLPSEQFRKQLLRAIGQLKLKMCSHRSIHTFHVLERYRFDNICLLNASESHVDASRLPEIRRALDQHRCPCCPWFGTYTTWGFVARYTQDSDSFWLDIEMMLCRPMFDCGLQDASESPHWKHHTLDRLDVTPYGVYWGQWAKVVAEDGFDWRVQLPPAFLKQPSRGLLDFPLKS